MLLQKSLFWMIRVLHLITLLAQTSKNADVSVTNQFHKVD